jgi:CspA family cold shock protein
MVTGRVKWFDDERGFGYLTREAGGEDVFCHFSVLQRDGCYRKLAEGQKVEFDVCDTPAGLVAANVRRVFDANGKLVTVLCGDAVQVNAMPYRRPNLATLAERLRGFGDVRQCEYLVRLRAPPHELTLFDDGRAIVKGTSDEAVARSLVTRWLGVRIPE